MSTERGLRDKVAIITGASRGIGQVRTLDGGLLAAGRAAGPH